MTDQETISLAQLCAYLPYGIEVNHAEFGNVKFSIEILSDITQLPVFAEVIKPLLRPMNEANKVSVNDILGESELRFSHGDFYTIDVPIYEANDYDYTYFEPKELPYEIVHKLLAAHYDIFGLIEQGLALPIE